MLTSSTPLIVLISLSFIVAFLVALPATFLIATRNIFAWSFDRLVPQRLSDVNERTHSPVVANVVVLIVTLIYLALIVFAGGDFLDLLFTAGLAELLTFMVVAIAGIAFPSMRRALYDASPIKRSIAGIPTLTIVGILALIVYAFFFYSLATTDALGANASVGIRATVIIAAISLLIYPIAVLGQSQPRRRPQARVPGAAAGVRLFRRTPRAPHTRVFFATDLHGSERCFRKWLNAAAVYEADALILGGDLSGKVLVPVVAGSGRDAAELDAERAQIRMTGRYPIVVTPDEQAVIEADPAALDSRFQQAMEETLQGWVELADERLAGSNVAAFTMLGNDDAPELADVLRSGTRTTYAEDGIVELPGGFEMASCGYSTPTPWHTPRELSEDALAERLTELLDRLRDPARAVVNLHCPPAATHLDNAAKLDAEHAPRRRRERPRDGVGRLDRGPVGDRALPADARPARARPRVARHGEARRHALHQPGVGLRGWRPARRDRGSGGRARRRPLAARPGMRRRVE